MIMATLAKKFRMRTSSGAVQLANIYSTPGEANNNTMRVLADDIAGYVAVGSIGDPRQTNGRVRKTNGVTYAILTDGAPAYGYGYYTSNGSFTVPAGVTKLRVTCVGGGAGGMLERDCDGFSASGAYTLSGVEGGTTTFGSVVANGATSSVYSIRVAVSDDGEGNTFHDCYNSRSVTNSSGTQSGTNAINGSNSSHGYQGAAAVSLTRIDGTSAGSAGAGGGVTAGQDAQVCTGGSGYKTTQFLSVSPGQTISCSIGSGGKCLHRGTLFATAHNDGRYGIAYPGSNGAVLVEWGEGIQ